jgi:hypothetical protein
MFPVASHRPGHDEEKPILMGLADFSAATAGTQIRAIERRHATIARLLPLLIISLLLSELVIERSPVQKIRLPPFTESE